MTYESYLHLLLLTFFIFKYTQQIYIRNDTSRMNEMPIKSKYHKKTEKSQNKYNLLNGTEHFLMQC